MTRDHQHKRGPNVNTARLVAGSTRDDSKLPADLEAARAEWSRRVQRCTNRGRR